MQQRTKFFKRPVVPFLQSVPAEVRFSKFRDGFFSPIVPRARTDEDPLFLGAFGPRGGDRSRPSQPARAEATSHHPRFEVFPLSFKCPGYIQDGQRPDHVPRVRGAV